MTDFERDRAVLSHDRLGSSFLIAIAFSASRRDSEVRNKKFLTALQGDDSCRQIIQTALDDWPALWSEIASFLGELSERYGFVLSDEYLQEKSAAIEGNAKIDSFIRAFSSGGVSQNQLDQFWEAMDRIVDLLRNLGRERARYVLDYDPRLLRKGVQ